MSPDTGGGGESTIVDSQQLFKNLQDRQPELLQALLEDNAATFYGQPPDKITKPVFERDPDTGLTTVRFRDDDQVEFSERLAPQIPTLRDEMNKLKTEFTLGKGQGYIVNNRRILHGRTEIRGPREALRAHVDVNGETQIGQDVKIGFSTELPH